MSNLYSVNSDSADSYSFVTDAGDTYSYYFLEYLLPDSEGNEHVIYNFDFLCNYDFSTSKFSRRYDSKIRNTLVAALSGFFEKREYGIIVFCCFDMDGYGRHRSIVFKQWLSDVSDSILKIHRSIAYNGNITYSTLLLVDTNPLKELIIEAFDWEIRNVIKP